MFQRVPLTQKYKVQGDGWVWELTVDALTNPSENYQLMESLREFYQACNADVSKRLADLAFAGKYVPRSKVK